MPVDIPSPSAAVPTIELKSYNEGEEHLVKNEPEPRCRSQTLKFHWNGCVWWIRVTFLGIIYQLNKSGNAGKKRKIERRKDFQKFVQLINYHSLHLLDDTVTEVILTLSRESLNSIEVQNVSRDESNIFIDHAKFFDYKIREDPLRVIYPSLSEFPTFPTVDLSSILEKTDIADNHVFRVRLRYDKKREYVYKTVDRPFYTKEDTEAIRKELENLEYFRNSPYIVQSAAAVVSINPYMTLQRSYKRLVIVGILLEFYSGGSLQQILDEHRLKEYYWQRWPLQIGTALSLFHDSGRTHLDIKLSNIVCDVEGNAVLIDISGVGGVTHSWLAPEMKEEEYPADKTFQARLLNDIWAYGKLLCEIAAHGGCPFAIQVRHIAEGLMNENPHSRPSLSVAIAQLRRSFESIFYV
jgi:serine/threonine protein kinase